MAESRKEKWARERNETLVRERALWSEGLSLVAGVDEVGVGPLAGPLLAAAVILPADVAIDGVRDSKKVSPKRREALFTEICDRAIAWNVGEVSAAEVDRLNPYQGALEAMRRAVTSLSRTPDHVLVDARTIPGIEQRQTAIVRGDASVYSIAAASIIAKVSRDRLMAGLDEQFPGYGFARHAGYGTPEHFRALETLGPCPAHRRSFAPVRDRLADAAGAKTR